MESIDIDPTYGYRVAVEEDEFSNGVKYYTAFAPELPNCLFQADGRQKAIDGIFDLIVHFVPLMEEIGNTPPKPLSASTPSAALQ